MAVLDKLLIFSDSFLNLHPHYDCSLKKCWGGWYLFRQCLYAGLASKPAGMLNLYQEEHE